jgi:ABC-type transport system involved in cytochrome bd biosynthesis fused ATPase/permease subunit
MTAAIKEMPIEQVRGIDRKRRSLEEVVSDARADLAIHQAAITSLAPSFTDASDESAEIRFAEMRHRLRELTAALAAAEIELASFNQSNPTPEAIAQRERDLIAATIAERKESALQAFGANLAARIEILDALDKLEIEALAIVTAEKRATPNSEACVVDERFTTLMPNSWFIHLGYRHGSAYALKRQEIVQWLDSKGLPKPTSERPE